MCGFILVSIFYVSLCLDYKEKSSSGGEGVVGEGEGGNTAGIEGPGEAQTPATPLSRQMMKKSLPVDHPRTPSPPLTTISPSSPPYTQVRPEDTSLTIMH